MRKIKLFWISWLVYTIVAFVHIFVAIPNIIYIPALLFAAIGSIISLIQLAIELFSKEIGEL